MDRRADRLLMMGIIIGGAGIGAFSVLLLDAHLVSREVVFPLQPMLFGSLAGAAIAMVLYVMASKSDH